jgi:small subunit ribosomal protein S19
MAKETTYRGKNIEELQAMGYAELAKFLPARARRTLNRGLTEKQKKLLAKLKVSKKPVRTHCRDMLILPEMVGTSLMIYSGQKYNQLNINIEMVGRYLGEFVLTRKEVTHKAPGVGATKGTRSASMK